jgi:hypothetical protein
VKWTPQALDTLERAIAERSRVQLVRRGTEFVLVPERLRDDYGGEILSARHPVTGERLDIPLDEIEALVVLG